MYKCKKKGHKNIHTIDFNYVKGKNYAWRNGKKYEYKGGTWPIVFITYNSIHNSIIAVINEFCV